jgi:M6 family metalloprotease-like protein
MKNIRKIIFLVSLSLCTGLLVSSPLHFEPTLRLLPDGKQLQLYISGDEFFNYLHDENGFPVREGDDGYYYYLEQKGDDFFFTDLKAGYDNPAVDPDIKEVTVPSTVAAKRAEYQSKMEGSYLDRSQASATKSFDNLNNLVLYIKFSDEASLSKPLSYFTGLFNNLTGTSVRGYYREISGGSFDVVSYNFPGDNASTFVYTDNNPRSFFQPYDSKTNPEGYADDNDRTEREHGLLERAVLWASASATLPEGVNFDVDNNGVFDNVSFIVSGTPDGWADLLWPHRWTLYTRIVKIGSLRVGGYTFQMENVSVTTLSHEIFHSLGAPDLYHYNDSRVPVGPWDIMASGKGHPGAWMKYKYGAWISEIPGIAKSGRYTLKPAGEDGIGAVIINSPYSDEQFFVAEYRKKTGLYESYLPATGLTISRIDRRYNGNADGSPDEIYVFRYNGTYHFDGYPNLAALPGETGATSFNDTSNPYGFLQDGSASGMDIYDIVDYGDSVSFSVNVNMLYDLQTLPVSYNLIKLSWKAAMAGDFIVAVSDNPETLRPVDGKPYYEGDTIGNGGTILHRGNLKYYSHTGLESDRQYYYTVWGVTDEQLNQYSMTLSASERTGIYYIADLPHTEDFDDIEATLPLGWKSTIGAEGWSTYLSGPDPAITMVSSSDETNILYTPGFMLSAGRKYAVTFNYRNVVPGVSESFSLRVGADRQSLALGGNIIFSSGDISLSGEIMYRALVRPDADGIYYLGFTPEKKGRGVVLNRFRVETVPDNTVVLTDPVHFYPNPSDGLITVPANGTTAISVYSNTGTKLYETVIQGMSVIDLSHLGKGIYIIKFTSGNTSSSRRLIID